MRRPAHEATTAQLGSAFPFIAPEPLPGGGVFIGWDHCRTAFVHDPFELYRLGVITNPNMIVLGQIGRGKSAFVKSYLYRHAAFGRRIVVFDPKGEYGPLARALGAMPVALRPGGHVRLNPLDVPRRTGLSPDDLRRSRLEVLDAVCEACLGRPLRPPERVAAELALELAGVAGEPTIPAVVEALFEPDPALARSVGLAPAVLRREGRDLAFELRRFVVGDLSGIFDGPTSAGIDLAGRVLVVDLSALYNSSALGVALACARGGLEAAFRFGGGQTIVVVDEAWAVLANLGAARFLQSSFKMARAFGVANLAVVHRVSDLAGGADAGSAGRVIAEGLIDDCETAVVYAQSVAAASAAQRALGLGDRETELVRSLPRGHALWRVAGRSFVVEHRLAPTERDLVDTDQRLVGSA